MVDDRARWRLTPAWVLLGLLPVLLFVVAESALSNGDPGFPLDDSWIHLAFADNLIQGNGLAIDPGHKVSGSTAPLWTALVALLLALPGPVVVKVKMLGVALHLLGADAGRRLALELGLSRGFSYLAGVLLLFSPWLVWGALSGMEIPLFVLLSVWGIVLCIRERRRSADLPLGPMVLALATLARPEGCLLLVLAWLDRCFLPERAEDGWRLRRVDLRYLAGAAGVAMVVLLPLLLTYLRLSGDVLPTTFAVKAGDSWSWPSTQFFYIVGGIFFRSQPLVLLFAAAGGLRLAGRLGGDDDRGLLPLLWLLALPLAYAFLTPPGKHLVGNFGRYFFPLFPPLVVLGLLGLEPIVDLLASPLRFGRLAIPLRPLAVVLLLAPTLFALTAGASLYARAVADVQNSDVRLARWLAPRLPEEAVLAVQDIGAFGFFLPNRLLDLAGIATPEIRSPVLESAGPEDPGGSEGMWRFLAERRPDYLVVWPAWHPRLTGNPELLRPILELELEGNVAMAGDRLTLYATPWTRYPLSTEPIP